jgi:hypothetical protein
MVFLIPPGSHFFSCPLYQYSLLIFLYPRSRVQMLVVLMRNLPTWKTMESLLLACSPFSPEWAMNVVPSRELKKWDVAWRCADAYRARPHGGHGNPGDRDGRRRGTLQDIRVLQ